MPALPSADDGADTHCMHSAMVKQETVLGRNLEALVFGRWLDGLISKSPCDIVCLPFKADRFPAAESVVKALKAASRKKERARSLLLTLIDRPATRLLHRVS